MENVVFRRATVEEMPRIIQMQSDVFSGEQGIPSEDLDVFMEKSPICWCAEKDGKIYAAVAALPADKGGCLFPLRRGHAVRGTVRLALQRRQMLIGSFFHAVPPFFFLLPFLPEKASCPIPAACSGVGALTCSGHGVQK